MTQTGLKKMEFYAFPFLFYLTCQSTLIFFFCLKVEAIAQLSISNINDFIPPTPLSAKLADCVHMEINV